MKLMQILVDSLECKLLQLSWDHPPASVGSGQMTTFEAIQPGKANGERPRFHIMSVDVEDYFQVEAFAGSISRESWDQWPSRVVNNTRRILELFARYQIRATFFFLGWVAKRFPELVREVHAAGHELACHSFWHRPVYSLTAEEFRQDTRAAVNALQQAADARILGYRAPTWSITKQCPWALDILAQEGFAYDSSIYPIRHDLHGTPDGHRFAYRHSCANGRSLIEFPPTTVRVAGMNFPAAGGGYLRIFPLSYTNWAFRHIEADGQPVVVYLHPWELDPGQPQIQEKLRSRLRHYTNLHRTEGRLGSLLERHRFHSFSDALGIEVLRMEKRT